MTRPTVIVALGANLGEPVRQLRAGVTALEALADGPVWCSSCWESTPVDCPSGSPRFVNAVAFFAPRPGETPESLLAKFKALESEAGRRPKRVLNEARPLDLDLIAWGAERRATEALVLPHPRAHLREFVLRPLAELLPKLVLPEQTRTVEQLLDALTPDPLFRRVQG
jgi:2-amino-4-hydroxy-6-hydroxymethyldihydropteridine diphosphokinase